MLENTESEITIALEQVEKKEWQEPHIMQLNVKETKGGFNPLSTETEYFLFKGINS